MVFCPGHSYWPCQCKSTQRSAGISVVKNQAHRSPLNTCPSGHNCYHHHSHPLSKNFLSHVPITGSVYQTPEKVWFWLFTTMRPEVHPTTRHALRVPVSSHSTAVHGHHMLDPGGRPCHTPSTQDNTYQRLPVLLDRAA